MAALWHALFAVTAKGRQRPRPRRKRFTETCDVAVPEDGPHSGEVGDVAGRRFDELIGQVAHGRLRRSEPHRAHAARSTLARQRRQASTIPTVAKRIIVVAVSSSMSLDVRPWRAASWKMVRADHAIPLMIPTEAAASNDAVRSGMGDEMPQAEQPRGSADWCRAG